MAYSLRDIIKQRTGEVASSGIQPTIFKFSKEDEWIVDPNIKIIGEKMLEGPRDKSNESNFKNFRQIYPTELPNACYIKQVGTNVKYVGHIYVEHNNITSDIFKYAENVIQFNGTFGDYNNITSIPEDLFANCPNVKIFKGVFCNAHPFTNIPEKLFVNNRKVVEFDNVFSYTGITSIPEKLFANNLEVRAFKEVFGSCYALKKIPEHLFDNNIKADNFNRCFSTCSSLRRIPKNLFANNVNVSDITYCFSQCFGLWNSTVSKNLFANNHKITEREIKLCFYDMWNKINFI